MGVFLKLCTAIGFLVIAVIGMIIFIGLLLLAAFAWDSIKEKWNERHRN